ncbi:MAG TPA: DUF362 domain-containing protein [Thermoprotei archaeon]|nr:DUF362 domain-containing protein [Thermoprotei archaeon]
MASKIYFCPAKLKKMEKTYSLPRLFRKSLETSNLNDIIESGNIVAIKIHVGDMERAGYRYIRQVFVQILVEYVKEIGGIPFITDTWGLKHVIVGLKNGFNYASIGAPLIPANGIKENFYYDIELEKYLQIKTIQVAGNIYDADVLINLAHGKGHGSCGYGGVIKNIAMGCTSYKTRGEIHRLEKKDNIGKAFQEGLADAVKAVLKNKRRKAFHIAYLMDIQPTCDCAPWSDIPIVPDIGILLSDDPIAVDYASLKMIDEAEIVPTSIGEKLKLRSGENKWLKIHGKDPYIQIDAGYKIGLGRKEYKLIEV